MDVTSCHWVRRTWRRLCLPEWPRPIASALVLDAVVAGSRLLKHAERFDAFTPGKAGNGVAVVDVFSATSSFRIDVGIPGPHSATQQGRASFNQSRARTGLPRDPGLELFFFLEAGGDRFGVAAVRILADADAEGP